PYPLSDREFLCVRALGNGEQMGIFLLDLDGREELLHAELPGCFDPMPLAARHRPPVIPSRIDLTKSHGHFYVADVYAGTGMEQIERGTVKTLRVVESPEKRFWTNPAWDGGTGQQAPAMAWDDFNNKCILGTAPVEEDGSAYFSVPADRFVYFQLLDERGMMIQSMRSGTIVRPGETVGCVGCHENRSTSVPTAPNAAAMRRPPSPLQPWYGPERNFGYLAEVQPVFDKHCVRCHDYGQQAGQKLNLAGDLGLPFNTSYAELRTKKYVTVPGAGPFQTLLPKSWGSHASRLAEVLLHGHGDREIDAQVQVDEEGFGRIVTWIDINAPYYPEYASAYRDNRYGRSPLDDAQLAEIHRLTGSDEVNFTRPAWSPCLARFQDASDPARVAALAIIEQGYRRLADRPRADMAGFRLVSDTEIRQQAKYDALRSAEIKAREAIVRGEKQFQN
ncbi:MAG: HzsA-related protein, partial [Pirellulaceae bacterium]